MRRSRRLHRALVALCGVALLASAGFGLRSYWSLQLMRSAYAVGTPGVSNIRPWMSLRVVATSYRVGEKALIERLGLGPETDPETSLRTLADRQGTAALDYVRRTQEAVAAIAPPPDAAGAKKRESWLGAVGDRFLDGLMVYGYPVLGLTLLLGAIGLPLPAGLLTIVAGSMVAQGQMSWAWAGGIAVAASVAGDMAGYRLGQALGGRFLQRWGRWIGYTAARRIQVERQFERHGMLTVILSRTLASYLSSVVNLLAGAGRYRFARFLALALVGRLLWSAAYLGLGYFGSNGDLDAATRLLQNLSAMLISLALLAVSIRLTFRSAPADTGNTA